MDAEVIEGLSAQQRLALSRRALIRQLGGRDAHPADELLLEPELQAEAEAQSASIFDKFAWSSIARNFAKRWWRRHPANAMGQLARPVLDRYARDEPLKLVAACAAAGAVVVLVRPWRLLSITALLAAALKTSDVADVVTTLMQKNSTPRKDLT